MLLPPSATKINAVEEMMTHAQQLARQYRAIISSQSQTAAFWQNVGQSVAQAPWVQRTRKAFFRSAIR